VFKELKVFIKKKIKSLSVNGLTDWNSVILLVSEVVQEVESTYKLYFSGEKISEEKKQAAKDAVYKIIDSVPLPMKFFKIPIPSFIVRIVIKRMASKLIDEIVDYYNKNGKFKHLT
jgi:hypothetical protein